MSTAKLCRRKTCSCECSLPEFGGFCSAGCQDGNDLCKDDKQGRHSGAGAAPASTAAASAPAASAPPLAQQFQQPPPQQQAPLQGTVMPPPQQHQQPQYLQQQQGFQPPAPHQHQHHHHHHQQMPSPQQQQMPPPSQQQPSLGGPVAAGNGYSNPYAGGGGGVAAAGGQPQQQQQQQQKPQKQKEEPLRNDPTKYEKFYPGLEFATYTDEELNGKYKSYADKAFACACCKSEFGITRWKHRCRVGGCVVCDDCAPKEEGVRPGEAMRVCDRCSMDKFGIVRKKGIARCATEGCLCDSYNGLPGERCTRSCAPGRVCRTRAHAWNMPADGEETRQKAEKWQRERADWLAQNPGAAAAASKNQQQQQPQHRGGGGMQDLAARPAGGGGGGGSGNGLPSSPQQYNQQQQHHQKVDANLNSRHGNSGHPLANCPTKLIDDYLIKSIAPRMQKGEANLKNELTDSNNHSFTDQQPPPKLNELGKYLQHLTPMTQPAPSYAQALLPLVGVVDADTLVHTKTLHDTGKYKNIAFLNMANAHWVGGGWSVAIGAQEEYLFRNSTLSLALWRHRAPQQDGFRPWDIGGKILGPASNDPAKVFYPMSKYATIYTRKVEVFALQDQVLPPNQAFTASALSMAAQDLRPPKGSPRGTPDLQFDANLNLLKIRSLLFTAVLYGCDALVLGAVGSGVFRCDPVQMASLFRQALEELHGSYPPGQFPFKKVDFAILGGGNNLRAYQQVLQAP